MALLHWKLQRISAILLVPAILYTVIYFLSITQLTYPQIISDITSFWGMVFIILTSFVLFTHSSLGIETIMEDYIHDAGIQRFFITLSKLIHAILLIATLVSLMMIKGT